MSNSETFIITIRDYGERLPDQVEYIGPFGSLAEAKQEYHDCIEYSINSHNLRFISQTSVICNENNQRYNGKIYALK